MGKLAVVLENQVFITQQTTEIHVNKLACAGVRKVRKQMSVCACAQCAIGTHKAHAF